jgi:NitT/TauT family transport system ATP-binding protein
MSNKIKLPSYLEQSDEVRDRFDRMKAREVILEVKNLSKTYKTAKGDVMALKNINFKTHRRELVCIIGQSGCGKSTLIRILAGLESHTGGEVLLDNKPVTGPGRDGIPRLYAFPMANSQEEHHVRPQDEQYRF